MVRVLLSLWPPESAAMGGKGQDVVQHGEKSHAATSCLVAAGTYQHWHVAGAPTGDAALFRGDNITYPA